MARRQRNGDGTSTASSSLLLQSSSSSSSSAAAAAAAVAQPSSVILLISPRRCLFLLLFVVVLLETGVILQISPNNSITLMDSSQLSLFAAFTTPQDDPSVPSHATMNKDNNAADTSIITVSVAYVISVTHCNWELIEAAAIHGHSIDLAHYYRSNHTVSKFGATAATTLTSSKESILLIATHTRYAMVHPDAQACIPVLREALQYQTHFSDIPLSLDSVQSPTLRQVINAETTGCCGAKELLKLYAFTLEEHDVVVHLDTDVLVFQPPWDVIAAMLIDPADNTNHHHQWWPQTEPPRLPQLQPPSTSFHRPNFFFTRDYLQASYYHHTPEKFAVQGGMFILKPNRTVFDDLIVTIQQSDYSPRAGWGGQGFGGYWGAPQIQGLLSYYYYLPQQAGTAVELNRCYYNNMGSERSRWFKVPKRAKQEGQCTTARPTCQDCRNVSLSDLIFAHFTMCNKPWKCLRLIKPDATNLCYALHQAWFAVRESLERQHPLAATRIRWPMSLQSRRADRPFWTNATLSYCTNPNETSSTGYRPKRGTYHPLEFINISSLINQNGGSNLIPRLTPTRPRLHNNRTKKGNNINNVKDNNNNNNNKSTRRRTPRKRNNNITKAGQSSVQYKTFGQPSS